MAPKRCRDVGRLIESEHTSNGGIGIVVTAAYVHGERAARRLQVLQRWSGKQVSVDEEAEIFPAVVDAETAQSLPVCVVDTICAPHFGSVAGQIISNGRKVLKPFHSPAIRNSERVYAGAPHTIDVEVVVQLVAEAGPFRDEDSTAWSATDEIAGDRPK